MTIVKALKAFFKNLTGKDVTGNTISDVIRDANKNSLDYSDRLDTIEDQVDTIEDQVDTIEEQVDVIEEQVGKIEEQVGEKEILLASSTASSTKVFAITVADDGTITATEKV